MFFLSHFLSPLASMPPPLLLVLLNHLFFSTPVSLSSSSFCSSSCSLLCLPSLFPAVSHCHGGCAEVDSLTEAVAGGGFLLGCISCKRREEVFARATVDWHFKPLGEEEFSHVSSLKSLKYMPAFGWSHPKKSILNKLYIKPKQIFTSCYYLNTHK